MAPAMPAGTYLLRIFGFEFINGLRRTLRGPEEPKIVLRSSFIAAAQQVTFHMISISSLTILIWLNYKTFYIGPTFTVWGQRDAVLLAMIQVFAKLLELFCVSSLGIVVLQALRRELLGDGLPLGLLGAGVWFNNFSFLWSPDFLMSAPWSIRTLGRLQLYILILLCGALATFVGPSSAVLMLPRYQDMPAGGASVYLPGTVEDFHPKMVTSASEIPECTLDNATDYAVCPSGGFTSLQSTLSVLNYSNFASSSGFRFSPQIQAAGAYGDWYHEDILIQSPASLVPPVLSTFGLISDNGQSAMQPHAATVILLQQLVREWADIAGRTNRRPESQWKWSYDLTTSGFAANANVRTKCTGPQVLPKNATVAKFPFMVRYELEGRPATSWADNGSREVYQDFSILGLANDHTNHIRTQWVSFPVETFPGIALHPSGLLVELPWLDGARTAFGCSFHAAWHNASVSATRSASYDAWRIDFSFQSNHDGYIPQNSYDVDASNMPVLLDKSWLDLLTPPCPIAAVQSGTRKPNTLESLLYQAGYAELLQELRMRTFLFRGPAGCTYRELQSDETSQGMWPEILCGSASVVTFLELVVTLLISDGLARFGSHRVFAIQPQLQDWSLPQPRVFNTSYLMRQMTASPAQGALLTRWLTISITGYGYFASTTTDYLAIAVIGVYLTVVVVHLVWNLARAALSEKLLTSSSWDTVTELLVLCQNSPVPGPGTELANASGGIAHLGTYKTEMQIRTSKPAAESQHRLLQLVIKTNARSQHSGLEEVVSKQAYG